MEVNVRKTRDSDVPAVVRLLQRTATTVPESVLFNPYQTTRKEFKEMVLADLFNVRRRACIASVATMEDKVVGNCTVHRLRKDNGYLAIHISPELVRHGVGSVLLKETLRMAVEEGIRKVYGEIHTRNDASRRFCIRNGFVFSHEPVPFRKGRDMEVMEMSLLIEN